MNKNEEIIIRKEDRYLTLTSIGVTDGNVFLGFEEEPRSIYCHQIYIEGWDFGYDFFQGFKFIYKTSHGDYNNIDKDKLLNTYIYLAQKVEKWKKLKAPAGVKLIPSILCNICKHRTDYNTCKAFPEGIPKELQNKLHRQKHPSQENDIVFELGEDVCKNDERSREYINLEYHYLSAHRYYGDNEPPDTPTEETWVDGKKEK